jgi:ATP-binding cassette, subfamily B, multidrug efflux pump
MSLEAKAGQTIALVGPTGAGKTTIINLLTRFYDIDNGAHHHRRPGHPPGQEGRPAPQLGIVLQDTFLFADTVMENIRYGRLDATTRR